jgi:hypothetical protein
VSSRPAVFRDRDGRRIEEVGTTQTAIASDHVARDLLDATECIRGGRLA